MFKELGQYFTKNELLLQNVFSMILNQPELILEPSVGQGHLVDYVLKNNKEQETKKVTKFINFNMIEIDTDIEQLPSIDKSQIQYGDFLELDIKKKYKTIIGNPPFVKKKGGNLYIRFIDKCVDLLDEDGGELIFIIPSDFFKITSASKTIEKMVKNGYFSHIYHPHDEHLFEGASIDVLIFRYVRDIKNSLLKEKNNEIKYNNTEKYIIYNNGTLTFEDNINKDYVQLNEYFHVYVGMVSGCEELLKNNAYGNAELLVEKDKNEKYIFIDNFETQHQELQNYLLMNKEKLINRKVRKINETNWYEFGLPRNKKNIDLLKGKSCIYIHNLTRKDQVAFKSIAQYFGGNLIMIIPKEKHENKIDLDKCISYFNSSEFKNKYLFSNRFKISQKNIKDTFLPTSIIC